MATRAKLLTTVEFQVDFPDDTIEDEKDIVRPGGLNIAEAIVSLLREEQFDVSEPSRDGDKGWEIYVKSGDRKFWLLVTDMRNPCLMSTDDVSSIFTMLFFKRSAPYADFLGRLHSILSRDQRFHAIRWYPIEWDARGAVGAKTPLGEPES